MPRWAFLSLLAGGVVLGLYLRSRRRAQQSTEPEALPTDSLGTSEDPGLAGVGVISPPGGVYPVSSPVLPEGFTDIVGSLTGVIGQQGETLAAVAQPLPQSPPVVNVQLPTGGGPPATPPKKAPCNHAKYLADLRSIRDRHGANSPEVKRYRDRHPNGCA
jgi:hypothetical protein